MSDDIFHTEDSVVEAGLKRFAADQPIVMVNLLHYREVADYGEGSEVTRCSGREAYYQRYAPPIIEVIRRLGGGLVSFAHVGMPISAAPGEHWDDVMLIEYPSFKAVAELLATSEYERQLVHRIAALADTRVFATVPGTEIR